MIGPIGCLWGRIPSREPPCRVWQVGVGVNPSLDAGGTLQLYARVVHYFFGFHSRASRCFYGLLKHK